MANNDKIPDYTSSVNAALTRPGSPLHDFPFTDSLTYDSQYEVDSQPVLTAGLFRTSRGPDRVQMATFNELGAQQGGFYLYKDGVISTAYTLGTIFFYDLTGTESAVIQQPSPGILSFSADTEINIIAPTINLNGDVVVTGSQTFGGSLLPDTDNAYDIGSVSFAWKDGYFAGNVYMAGFSLSSYLIITDGITAPGTSAGFAKIYVDTADGDLKIKFGDGTVKTIVTDT